MEMVTKTNGGVCLLQFLNTAGRLLFLLNILEATGRKHSNPRMTETFCT